MNGTVEYNFMKLLPMFFSKNHMIIDSMKSVQTSECRYLEQEMFLLNMKHYQNHVIDIF